MSGVTDARKRRPRQQAILDRYRRKKTLRGVDRKVSRLNSKMNKMVQLKRKDTNVNTTIPAGAPPIVGLNLIAEGDSSSERDGLQAQMMSVNWRFNMIAGDSTNVVRIMIFRFNGVNGTLPTYAEIMEDVSVPTGAQSFLAFGNKGKIKVYYDESFALSLQGPATLVCKGHRRLNFQTNYGLAAGTINGLQDGGLFIMFLSDSGATVHPSILGNVRVRYYP